MAETEAILLRRFTSTGDAAAFAEITRRHAGLVYGAALRIVADVDRAADVAQETFLQLTKDAHSVTGSVPGWLHRVATHKAIDLMRRDTSRRRREAEYAAEHPREVTDWKELSRHVDEELNRLDNETREILVAHFLQGRTTRQIAITQGVSQATVSRRVEAGVTRMRATLRRRGVLVAAGTLSMLLGENAVQAAPSALMAELGKMALIGGHAAAASAAGSAAGSAGSSMIQTFAGGVLAGVKAKAVAATAVAVIGAGSVVTYQHATRPSSPENIVVTRSPTSRSPARAIASTPVSSPPRVIPAAATTGSSDAAQRWKELMRAGLSQPGNQAGPTPQGPIPQPDPAAPEKAAETAPPDGAIAMVQGFGMGGGPAPAEPPEERPPEEPVQPAIGGMFFGGAGLGPTPPKISDSNDSNDTSPEIP